MKRILYTLGALLLSTYLNSQSLPKVTPISPEAASLIRYAEYPVDYCTGIPNISIPIFEIKLKDFTLPISLSYHNEGGIKANSIVGWVGDRWTLNAEPMITRSVNGLPDEIAVKGYINTNFAQIGTDIQREREYADEGDGKPDMFYFKLSDKSGKFMFNKKEGNSFLALANIKTDLPVIIKTKFLDNTASSQFEITDVDGVNYFYGSNENSFSPTPSHVTCWKADKIVTPYNEVITFEYYDPETKQIIDKIGNEYITLEDNFTNRESSFSTIETNIRGDFEKHSPIINKQHNYDSKEYFPDNNGNISLYSSNSNVPTQNIYTSLRLKKINTPNCSVEFILTEIVGKRLLTKIIIKDISGNIINTFDLNYTNNGLKERLNSLSKSYLDNKIENYSFDYYPYYFYNEEISDFWGYKLNYQPNSYNNEPYIRTQTISTNLTTGYAVTPSNYSIEQLQNINLEIGQIPINYNNVPIENTLKRINLPTGGFVDYEYESNKFTHTSYTYPIQKVNYSNCGIRLKRMISCTQIGGDTIFYDYKYGLNENGLGIVKSNELLTDSYVEQIKEYLFTVDQLDYVQNTSSRFRTFYSNPISNPFFVNGVPVFYDKVSVYKSGKGIKAGKQIFTYKGISDLDVTHNEQYRGTTFDRKLLNSWDYNCLKSDSTFTLTENAYQLTKTTDYSYYRQINLVYADEVFKKTLFFADSKPNLTLPNHHVTPIKYSELYGVNNFNNGSYQTPNDFFSRINYFQQLGNTLLEKKTTRLFENNNYIESQTEYNYNLYNLPSEEIISNNAKTIKKLTKYPIDYSFSYYQGQPHPLQQMQMRNMNNYPVEQKTFVNNKLTEATITTYMSDNPSTSTGKIMPNAIYRLNTNTPLTDFTALASGDGNTAYTIDPRLSNEATYTYYTDGNIKEIINPKTGSTTVYLWSYNKQYPIAKIENATYTQVSNASNGFLSYIEQHTNPSDSQLYSLFNSIRGNLPDAMVTTYTYKPLVGISSSSDPRGVTTYYDYDEFNRLKQTYRIENGEKKILQKFDYHYATQQ